MSRRWDVFRHHHWRREFGLRPRDRAITAPIDADQLELLELLADAPAPRASPVENLRAALARSALPQREFAQWVLGCAEFTLSRYLRGDKIPECRRNWIARLESVVVHGDAVIIVVRAGEVRRLPLWRRLRSPSG